MSRHAVQGPLMLGLLPTKVAVEERFDDPPDGEVHPEEAAIVEHVVETRRREFTTARLCARLALARLGAPIGPILAFRDGAPRWARAAPRWPAGIVGSLTHCPGFRAAAVAREADVASLGIDAEMHLPLPAGVERLVALPDERDAIARLRALRRDVAWDRILFSAKESVYKAWFPLTGRWLDFHECRISLHPDDGTFVAVLLVPGPIVGSRRLDRLAGKWRATGAAQGGDGLLVTAVPVEPSRRTALDNARIDLLESNTQSTPPGRRRRDP